MPRCKYIRLSMLRFLLDILNTVCNNKLYNVLGLLFCYHEHVQYSAVDLLSKSLFWVFWYLAPSSLCSDIGNRTNVSASVVHVINASKLAGCSVVL